MSRRKEAGIAFKDVNPARPHVVVKQATEARVRGHGEGKPCSTRMYANFKACLLEYRFDFASGRCNFAGKILLQSGPGVFEVMQHRLRCGHGWRVTYECACEERHAHFRRRIISILPGAAVERVKIKSFPGDHSDGVSAADHLAVSCKVTRTHADT